MRHTDGSRPDAASPSGATDATPRARPVPRTGRARRARRLAPLAVALVASVVLGACGSGDDSGSTAATPTEAPTTSIEPTTTAAPTTTAPPTTTTTAPVPPPGVPTAPLAPGASGPAVLQLQQRLVELGYWMPGVDGRYGSGTAHAVTAFQKVNGLPRTGQADAATLAAMATARRPVATRPQPGRSLEADLGHQVLLVVNGGQVEAVLDLSSGKASTPTPKGDFRIQRQIDGLRISELGELWRPRYFTGGYAIHGSPSVPSKPASHGCIRLTNPEIDWVWSSGVAEIGTPLFVY